MKFIAHRGAGLECQENTLAALLKASEYGAYAVECDPRYTKDKKLVIFHDDELTRIAGDPSRVSQLTYDEMKSILEKAGKELTTLSELISDYKGSSPVLLDLAFDATDEDFYREMKKAPFRLIMGTHSVEETKIASRFFEKEDILAFMPSPDMASDFAEAGAGIIRLWEQWLEKNPISEVRKKIPADREIWIMSNDGTNHPFFCMNGSKEQIKRLEKLGADGILLNDIKTAMSL